MKNCLRTFLLGALLYGVAAFSQPPQDRPDHGPWERIEQLKKVRLIEMLDLTEEQSVRFFARMNEHDKVKKELIRQKGDLFDKIEQLVRNHAGPKEFEQVFPDVLNVDAKLAEENRKFFESLGDVLTADQRGKYLLFERHFDRELREAMRETLQRRHGMDGP